MAQLRFRREPTFCLSAAPQSKPLGGNYSPIRYRDPWSPAQQPYDYNKTRSSTAKPCWLLAQLRLSFRHARVRELSATWHSIQHVRLFPIGLGQMHSGEHCFSMLLETNFLFPMQRLLITVGQERSSPGK